MSEELFGNEGAKYSFENEEQVNQEAQADLGSAKVYRIKINNGSNRFWLLPSFDSKNGTPWRTAMIHFNPYHVCGRADWVAASTSDQKAKDSMDNKFANCPRCIQTWEKFDENVPKLEDGSRDKDSKLGKEWAKWRGSNMGSPRGLIQVINLTPFFTKSKSGDLQLDQNLVDLYWEMFCKIISGEMSEADLPENFPEDIFDSAMCGPQVISLDKDTIKLLQKEYRMEFDRQDEVDPTRIPSKTIMNIDRFKTDKSFDLKDGTKGYQNGHTVSFQNWRKKETPPDFKMLAQAMKPKIVNIHAPAAGFTQEELENLTPKEILNRRAYASERFNEQDMMTYLENCNWNINDNPANTKPASVSSEDTGEDVEVSNGNTHPNAVRATNPDQFDAGTVLSEEDMKSIEDFRNEAALDIF